MTSRWFGAIRRFRDDQRGFMAIEFVLYFVVLMGILTASLEIAIINLRHVMLERAVELAVRDIRLATGEVPTFEEVRQTICSNVGATKNCQSNLMLEMDTVDPRNFAELPATPDCVNAGQEPRPVRKFQPGKDNDLMLLRACLKYNPIFPSARLAQSIDIDAQGYAKLIVHSVFVQEPK